MEMLTWLSAPLVVGSLLAKRKFRVLAPDTDTMQLSAFERPMMFEAIAFTSSGVRRIINSPSAGCSGGFRRKGGGGRRLANPSQAELAGACRRKRHRPAHRSIYRLSNQGCSRREPCALDRPHRAASTRACRS